MIDFKTHQPDGVTHITVVALSGRLDTDSADVFFRRLEEEVSQGNINLIFDCQDLQHISSLGFGMMIRAHSRVQNDGGVVRFARLGGVIEEAFKVVGFHKLFDNYPTLEAAADSVPQAA